MKKIDASKWKEFLIGDLFDIHPTNDPVTPFKDN